MLLWEILEAEETLYKNWTGYTSSILKKVITSKNQGNVIPGGWRVTRALRWVWEIEFSEEGRWVYQRVTCNWFFHSSFVKIFLYRGKRSFPVHFYSIFINDTKRETLGYIYGKQEVVSGKSMKLINILLFFTFAPATVSLFCYLTFLLPAKSCTFMPGG